MAVGGAAEAAAFFAAAIRAGEPVADARALVTALPLATAITGLAGFTTAIRSAAALLFAQGQADNLWSVWRLGIGWSTVPSRDRHIGEPAIGHAGLMPSLHVDVDDTGRKASGGSQQRYTGKGWHQQHILIVVFPSDSRIISGGERSSAAHLFRALLPAFPGILALLAHGNVAAPARSFAAG